MHGQTIQFLQDLAIVMIVAGLVTVVFHLLRQPVVLGYILAGVIIGPYTPPFPLIADAERVEPLAEVGVIFLMFSLGLHFSLRKLAAVGATAVIAAVFEIVAMLLIGYGIGRAFGWSTMDSLFLGAILSISSTTIIIKALADLKLLKEPFAQLVFGILIVEDILAIAMLALLSGIAATGSLHGIDVIKTLGELTIFLVMLLVIGLLAVPWLLRFVTRFKSDEMLLITVLGLVFGVSLLAAKMEYSVALGAFIIGAIVAEAREAGRIETLIGPLRDMFSAVFFVAIGMLINPTLLIDYAIPILVITAAVVVGKVLTCTVGALAAGNDLRTSMRVGMGLAQIGEFSFIIAQLGLSLNVTSEFLYPIAVSVSAVTILLTPYLIRGSDRATATFERVAPRPLLGFFDTYHGWLHDLSRTARGGNQIRKLLRKWALQIGLNMALISGILIAAKSFAFWAERRGSILPDYLRGPRTVAWLAAMLLALPLLVATLRKMRAVSQVLAEMSVPRSGTGTPESTQALRGVVANAIFLAAALAMGVIILALSAALLPPWPVLLGLLVLIAAITIWRWNNFVKMYAKAQIALRTTLTTSYPPGTGAGPGAGSDVFHPDVAGAGAGAGPVLPLLRNAVIESIEIAPASPAAGKLIRELALRTRTGASAVGIERDGTSLINPGPDEELLPGDRVLLLGDPAQLEAARMLLTPGDLATDEHR